MSTILDYGSAALDWGIDFFANAFDLGSEIVSGGFEVVLSAIGDTISYLLYWFYNLIFIDLFGSCLTYGNKLLNLFFDEFTQEPFSFEAIAFYMGFVFLLYCLRLTVNIIRG